VNRESCIVFETNKYSIHPDFIGQNVCLRVDDELRTGEVFDGLRSLRVIELFAPGMRRTFIHEGDRVEILKRHNIDRKKRLRLVRGKTRAARSTEVEIRHPSAYEAIAGGEL